jgi:hypothetical protein
MLVHLGRIRRKPEIRRLAGRNTTQSSLYKTIEAEILSKEAYASREAYTKRVIYSLSLSTEGILGVDLIMRSAKCRDSAEADHQLRDGENFK